MGDPALEAIRAQILLDWEQHLRRVPVRNGLRVASSPERQINISKAYGFGTFLKDVTGLPGVPARPENGPLVMSGNLYRSNAVYTPMGVSDNTPMPTLLWGALVGVSVAEVAAPTTDQALALANNIRFAKTATVKADPANGGIIYVKGDGSAILAGPPITGYPLSPGETQVFPVKDLNNIHIYAGAAGYRLAVLYIPDSDHT